MVNTVHSILGACIVATLACHGQAADGLSQTVAFPMPETRITREGLTRISLPDSAPDLQTGRPLLPVAGVTFELPADSDVASITLTPGNLREIPLSAPVEWGQIPSQPFEEPPPTVSADPAIYSGTQLYPSYDRPVWRLDPTRAGKRLSVQIHPVRLDPVRNVLLAADSVTVTVTLKQAQTAVTSPQLAALAATALSPSPLTADGPYTYVVISTSNLISNTPGPWNLQALCAARARSGFTTKLVSTEWIQANYAGTNLAIRIRAFVQDAYKKWGVKYLLLAGTFNLLPVQRLHVSFVDLIVTRTADIPADAIYYGCMDGTFDINGNGYYGETNDGPNGGDVDLTAEVMVGRFPVANATELANMVRKTLRYESATAAELRPVAHIAEKVDLGSTVYATGFMEELRNGSTSYGLNTLGFEDSPYADAFDTDHTLYDADGSIWTTSDALAFLNQNLHFVNHLGHGAAKLCMKISLAQTANQNALGAFTNTMPYFVYSQACSPGAFDTEDCFAEQLVTVSNAAFAAVMNARDGWEFANSVGGFSHRYHRYFVDAMLRGNATRFGEINEYSRSMCLYLLGTYSANYWRWVYYELNLFGDPATPFAAAVNTVKPVIVHDPALINTYDTQTAYRVTCTVEPVGIFDPDAISLMWQSDRQPGLVRTQAMTQVTGNLFEAFIDPQQANTKIDYAIRALNHAGYETRSPDGSSNNTFYVTERLSLDILGSPTKYGDPIPAYGTYYFASGLVATVSAPAIVPTEDGIRVSNIGFFGTGSAPQSGTNLTVSFQMDTSSMIVWMWLRQYRLLVGTDIAGQPTQTFWSVQNAAIAVPDAAEQIALSNGTAYAFAEWLLDGVRSPALPARSKPSFGNLVMAAPHSLVAHYLPADLDADANGIPDWWEVQYYGTNGHDPESDEDEDGYTLEDEYRDRTNPLDEASVPAPPLIVFTPLNETQTHPGPFVIRATITDTHAVNTAVVYWHRKAEAWQSTPMQTLSNNLFTAQIGTVSAPGDDFEYQIIASDPDGRIGQTDVCFLFLRYPVADTSRFHNLAWVALPTQSIVYASMNLFNTGNADLVWSTRLARVESVTDPSLRTWNRVSIGQNWEASTNRSASAPYSLHSRLVSGGLSSSPAVHATIALPPLLIGANATLSFKHWIYSEVYSSTTRAFDGGIVEFSKDNGVTFQQLKGPYTHTIYGWEASPWTNDTPCFAGSGSEGWQTATFDLAKYYPAENGFQGRSIIFRFHYGADNNTDKEGWYIDDVNVSPLLMRSGFFNDIDPASDGTISAGDYRHILWYNLPTAMDLRDDNLTVFILSNDPVTPTYSFFWQIKIRDYPRLSDLSALQSNVGDGRVRLTTGVSDDDGEPLNLAVGWSKDNGKNWQSAALTNVLASTGTVSLATGNGIITHVLTTSGLAPLTNRLSAVWNSRAIEPEIAVNTQMVFRVIATNGYYGKSFTTARFTVDNVPPVFGAGSLTASPLSSIGTYAVTTNLLTLAWPAATDNPSSNLTYRLVDATATNVFVSTSGTLALSNSLNAVHTVQVVALDPAGNASEALRLSLLVLDALGDYDGDGMTTADEEIAGTSATQASDRFTVGLTSGDANALSIAWPSVVGRTYTIETTATLLPPDWQPLVGYTDIPGTGAPLSVPLPSGADTQFFRLKVYHP
jgi:hypothetical protein